MKRSRGKESDSELGGGGEREEGRREEGRRKEQKEDFLYAACSV